MASHPPYDVVAGFTLPPTTHDPDEWHLAPPSAPPLTLDYVRNHLSLLL
jgi:hypothetical protein